MTFRASFHRARGVKWRITYIDRTEKEECLLNTSKVEEQEQELKTTQSRPLPYRLKSTLTLFCPAGHVSSLSDLLAAKLASNTLLDNVLISPASAVLARSLSKLVARIKHTRRPASPPKVSVRVLVQHIKLLAQRRQTARIVRAARLGQDSLALVRS